MRPAMPTHADHDALRELGAVALDLPTGLGVECLGVSGYRTDDPAGRAA